MSKINSEMGTNWNLKPNLPPDPRVWRELGVGFESPGVNHPLLFWPWGGRTGGVLGQLRRKVQWGRGRGIKTAVGASGLR